MEIIHDFDWAIFNSYVSLPEGKCSGNTWKYVVCVVFSHETFEDPDITCLYIKVVLFALFGCVAILFLLSFLIDSPSF